MCGITGWVSFRKERDALPDRKTLTKMNDAIRHRGPDSDGIRVDGQMGLAMRRLAIIDLSPKGNQPMTSASGRSTIIFNGELYNFQELRALPELKGYPWRSNSDTEVVLALYESRGQTCVELMRGMFAFALWDTKEKILFCARDRLGKKPFYYSHDKDRLLFGSEIKALRAHPSMQNLTLDDSALRLYTQLGYVPAPWSIYQEIKKLPPAHTLIVTSDGKLTIKRYWDLDFNTKTTLTRSDATKKLRELLEESVRLRMISDVPLGVFLSGGIDSSVVAAIMARSSEKPIKTFSVGFSDKKYDELAYARLIAQQYKTDHTEIQLTPDFITDLPKIMTCFDEPFADASCIPTYYIAKATREHVTVALNGDGGDENFAGYTRYVWESQSRFLRSVPLSKGDIPRTGATRALELLGMNSDKRFVSLQTAFEEHHLYIDEKNTDIFTPLLAKPQQPLDKWLYADIMTYLPGDLLVKVDIATMANSLEGRSPFLDHKLMEFTASLPPSWKLSGKKTKIIFRDAIADLLPHEILTKPKQGFAVPINEWLRGPLKEYARKELLGPSAVLDRLDRKKIERMLDLHERGKPYGYRLWNLLMLREWEKNHFLTV